ncbi:MAG: histidine phosphatase family protein [Candidatus Saccharibacteria bacterium]|nr:histidine phosphatase family protein [Candidatus Saccharibacteria bacterium]
MSVYFVRHGESLANANGTVAGAEDDSPLTEQGLRDAYVLAQEVTRRITAGELCINKIVSSPLQRAYQTAEIISQEAPGDLPVDIDQRWRERGIGKAAGMKHGTWYHLEDDPVAGVETRQDFCKRVAEAYDKLAGLSEDVLVVSHNGVYRALQAYMHNVPPEKFVEMPGLGNGEIVEIAKQGESNE